MKLETLNFRCEKLQEDITRKHEQMTDLKKKITLKDETIEKLKMQLSKAERENRMNKEEMAPRLEALKSRYEVCMLEMVSLENDNKIMNERIQKLLRENSELRRNVRDMKKQKFEEKQQRLTLAREFETVKRTLDELTDKMTDLNLEKEDLFENLKRLKNENLTNQKKIQLLERENARLNTVLLSKGMQTGPEYSMDQRSHAYSRPELNHYGAEGSSRKYGEPYDHRNHGIADPNSIVSHAKSTGKYKIDEFQRQKDRIPVRIENVQSLANGQEGVDNSFEKPDETGRAIDSKDTVYVKTHGEVTLEAEHVENEVLPDTGNEFEGIQNYFIYKIIDFIIKYKIISLNDHIFFDK